MNFLKKHIPTGIAIAALLLSAIVFHKVYIDAESFTRLAESTRGTFTSYNDITDLAVGDHFLLWDASEGSGDELANVSASDLLGKMHPVPSDLSGNTTLTTTQIPGRFYDITVACTITLDAAADVGFGAIVGFRVRDAAETLTIEIYSADKINLHGTALDAGDTIDSPGNAGDFIFLLSTTDADAAGTDGWKTLGYGAAVWTDGGAT